MKLGDIYRWSWNGETAANMDLQFSAGTAYWCMDRFCVAVEHPKEGLVLMDTHKYNEYASDELFDYESLRNEFSKIVDPEKVDLDFVVNKFDCETIHKFEMSDYKLSNVFTIPCHSGYRPVYLKLIGAKPDKQVMIHNCLKEIEEKEYDIRSAENDIKRLNKQIKELENICYET